MAHDDIDLGKRAAIELTQRLLELSESNWVDQGAYEDFVEFMAIPPGEPKVDFLQRLKALIKRMSSAIVDQEVKEKMLEALQEYLDKAVEEEEILYEQAQSGNAPPPPPEKKKDEPKKNRGY